MRPQISQEANGSVPGEFRFHTRSRGTFPAASLALMRRPHLRLRILAVALLTATVILVPTRTQAQTLTGIVTDSAGRPLREAELLVGQGPSRTRADSMGRYSLRLPHGGRVQVMVRLVGYRLCLDTVRVPSFTAVRQGVE
jgi:hypothetical protein